MKPIKITFIFFVVLTTVSFVSKGIKTKPDSSTSGKLYDEIAHADSLLFDAFNSKNVYKMKTYFDSSVEVYQDNLGVRNYQQTMEAFGTLFKKSGALTRKLVPGSMEVYPIKGFGAIQTGEHVFSHKEGGKMQSATFKFMKIWKKTGNSWRITRLVTYDHPEDWK